MRVFHKLVRDKQPEQIKSDGYHPVVRQLDPSEYEGALAHKLREESQEVVVAMEERRARYLMQLGGNTYVREEMADVLEVLMAIAKACELEWSFIEWTREARADSHGRFEKRQLLVEIPDMPDEAARKEADDPDPRLIGKRP